MTEVRHQFSRLLLAALVATSAPLATLVTHANAHAASFQETIRDVQRKVVKIYGAGGMKELEAYQTGILISGDGHVLTVQSYVLDTDDLAVVLDDGRKFKAEVLGVDPVRELAVLKLPIEADALPHFDLNAAPLAKVGERVLAASNLFNIAGGDEPVSVLQGVVSGIAPLDARRGAHQASFHGNVYIVDAAANNPGAAGGALVNWRGQLVGLLGKELRSRSTGAWLHYAIPVDQFVASVETMEAGRTIDADDEAAPKASDPLTLAAVGIVLVPDILPRTPPYIDSVVAGSAAERAGLRPDDLLVFVEGEPTSSCSVVAEQFGRRESFDDVRISVLRDGKLVEATLNAEEAVEEPADEASLDDSDEAMAEEEPTASDDADAGSPDESDGETDAEATVDGEKPAADDDDTSPSEDASESGASDAEDADSDQLDVPTE
ncbi:S1C family serine protease [Lacipirellula parvula]|uniref:S1C family serine protease n=1 Tax=Lacipirellula parvula TaxID=2650471 RepID=UPI001E4ABF17|nr:trypsin-like peptidase domain-containing protein [Lacipirellula parvula]